MAKYELSAEAAAMIRVLLREEGRKNENNANAMEYRTSAQDVVIRENYRRKAKVCETAVLSLESPLKPTRTDDPDYDSDVCDSRGCVCIPEWMGEQHGRMRTWCSFHTPSYLTVEKIR